MKRRFLAHKTGLPVSVTGMLTRGELPAAAQGARGGGGNHSGSRLEDLHNAALLLGDETPQSDGQTPNGQATRRSRRQAGRAP